MFDLILAADLLPFQLSSRHITFGQSDTHMLDQLCCYLLHTCASELLRANPYNVTHGTDFVKECTSPHIDFASIHMYADQWCQGAGDEQCSR
jgi:hypothetical protein